MNAKKIFEIFIMHVISNFLALALFISCNRNRYLVLFKQAVLNFSWKDYFFLEEQMFYKKLLHVAFAITWHGDEPNSRNTNGVI